jgi:hypothetical protein
MAQQQSFAECFKENNEKVFVQLDKNVLIAGEELNFNAFVVNASTLKPGGISKILYFELDNAANIPVFSWRINLEKGIGSGMVVLPDSLQSGKYNLKAYTNWMRNNSQGFFYSTDLIINSLRETLENGYKESTVLDTTQIEIFPEGNNLLAGVVNKLGIRVLPAQRTSLTLKDNEGTLIATATTNSEGRAIISYLPQPGKSYTIIANDKGISKPLPRVYNYGTVLCVQYSDNDLIIKLRSRSGQMDEASKATLRFKSRGHILFDKLIDISKDSLVVTIPYTTLPAGIVEISLISENQRVLAKRMVAILPSVNNVNISLTENSLIRQKTVPLKVSTSGLSLNDSAFLALSVAADSQWKNRSVNHAILPYLLFSSELDGYCYSGDSFNQNQIDTILLTTTADQYLWSNARYDSISRCRFMAENKGYVFQGKLLQSSTLMPLTNTLVVLATSDSIPVLRYCKTDSLGRFYFLLNRFFDNRDLILQAQDAKVSDLLWNIDSKTTENKQHGIITQKYDPELSQYLDLCRNTQLVNAVYKTDLYTEPKVKWNENEKIYNFSYKPDFVVRPADYSELVDFNEISANILPTVSFKKSVNEYILHVFDIKNHLQYFQNASLLLNGIPFSDFSYLASLGSKDIDLIEIFSTYLMYGDWSFYGLLSVYTKDRKMPKSFFNDKNICFVRNRVAGEKPSEIYRDNSHYDNNLPDFKRTLYSGFLDMIEGNRYQILNIRTSNLRGIYTLDIQGITTDGVPMSFSQQMEVK